MFNMNKILGNNKKSKGIGTDMDKIFPKRPMSPPLRNQNFKIPNGAKVIVNNYYGMQGPGSSPLGNLKSKKILTTLDSVDSRGFPVRMPTGFQDMDRDGVPSSIDPDDFDPNVPNPMTTQVGNKRINKLMRDMLGGE